MLHCNRRVPRRRILACAIAAALPVVSANADPPPRRPEPVVRTLVARRGDTLAHLLATAGVERGDARPALTALAPLLPARTLRPGQELTLRQTPDGADLVGLRLEPAPGQALTVTRTPEGWQARQELAQSHRRLVLVRGTVHASAYDDLRAAGLPAPLAEELLRTLAHAVDFQRDMPPGSEFTVLFERWRDEDGDLLREGRVLHAGFGLAGGHLSLWRHETETGADWLDENGRSLRQAFLRTPLESARVTSGFGMRAHPVLGFTRRHQGIDFAAPLGTPVLAAADGVVEEVATVGGYGRTVRLRHSGDVETRYAHLSRFAAGLKAGDLVRQGQVIGQVGRTGLTTGPHLHYEIAEAGRPVDPARRPAVSARLEGAELARFQAVRQVLASRIARLAPLQEVAAAD